MRLEEYPTQFLTRVVLSTLQMSGECRVFHIEDEMRCLSPCFVLDDPRNLFLRLN